VALRYPQVITHLDLPSLDTAHVTVNADLHNASDHMIKGVLAGHIEDVHFQQDVEIGAQEWKRVSFSPERFPQLNLSHPRLWWPWQMGSQDMHQLEIEFRTGGQVSDRQQVDFGIREVTSELTSEGSRLFKVNGKKILIRGGLWWSDMLSRPLHERHETEMQYARDMHLNCLRMDGVFEDDHFLNLADRSGMLLMPGWPCCAYWEQWQSWKDKDYPIAVASTRDRIRWFRNHPSMMVWLNADDNPPPEKVARMYVDVLKQENWPNPVLASATGKPAAVTGPTGLKMSGPYEYVPPSYWLTDKHNGGAFGFLPEMSLGPEIPPVEGLREFLPADHLWPIDEYWDFHYGGGQFLHLNVFPQALNARYGTATGVEDFAKKAQAMDYEGERASYEAFGRNKYVSTGIVHEMMNQGWPSLIWDLYDYNLRPAGGYYGTKKACEPLHIQYSYDDRSVVVVNSLYRDFKGIKAKAVVYNLDLSPKFSKDATLDVAPDSSNRVLVIPELEGLSLTYFVRLTLEDSEGKIVSRNFYWLSTKPDVFDWDKTAWYYTPTKSLADLSGLNTLSKIELMGSNTFEDKGENTVAHVTVESPPTVVEHDALGSFLSSAQKPTLTVAFLIHLRVTRGMDGSEVLPILWEDNYFELMPGERREVAATFRTKDLQGAIPVVEVDGWNVSKSYLERRPFVK
jgi:exo-1,4-beta-D-glucosaminidase